MSTPRTLSRSAGIGLTAGLVLGAVFLAVRAFTLHDPSCEGMLAEDCALEQQIATSLTRLHALFAVGLAMVALGLYLSLRKTPGTR